MRNIFAAVLALSLCPRAAFAQNIESGHLSGARNFTESGGSARVVLAGWRDWFKSPAQKAADSDKIAFLKREGAFSPDMADGGSLTSLGNAAFQRLAKVYNEQSRLLKDGFVPVSAQDGRRLMAVESSVNGKIMTMQNDCMARVGELNLLLRALPNNANGVNDFSCDFINKAVFSRKSGNSYFAAKTGEPLLEAMNAAQNPIRKLLAIQGVVNDGINQMKNDCLSYMNARMTIAAPGAAGAVSIASGITACQSIKKVHYVYRSDDSDSYRPNEAGESLLEVIGE